MPIINLVRTIVVDYDVLFYIFLSRAVYLLFSSTNKNTVENTISVDRLDPAYLADKKLFDLLDSRGEVYRRSADRSRLVTLAKTKVVVEESVPPMLVDLKSLAISDLKQLLNQRGIMYYSRSTKHDLIGAVNISGRLFQQIVGIPMGTTCASLLADFSDWLPLIYPPELDIKETTEEASSASLLELYLEFDISGHLSTRINDTRDDLNSEITNFSHFSGPVTTEALTHMKRIGEQKIGPVHEFNAFNIEETVEKHNDSIFLINILPPRLKSSYFNESSWNALRRKLTYMDFKFGELDCDFEKRICLKRKWNISTLYLYTPGKENVTEYYIRDDYNIHSIFSSIQKEINYRVTHISSWDIFTSSQWAFYRDSNDKIAVRIILFTNMTVPPMFLSSLSVKYRDKVNFGMANMASNKGRRILRKLKQKYWPLCLVVTKQGILTYGKLPGEYFTYRELDFFLSNLLQDFQPTEKWYHKLSCFLDPTMIGLLIVRFVATLVLSRIGIMNEEGNQGNQHDGNDEDNNDTMENETHEAEQLRIINQKAIDLLREQLRARETTHDRFCTPD